jgi:Electron transfer DM13
MFNSFFSLCLLALLSSHTLAQDAMTTKLNYTGTLSSLDGGLGGTVTVLTPTTLRITDYTLKDASAPALYWWGTTADGELSDGFRVSNEQVTDTAAGLDVEITLDAGKTTADFDIVGLWCERFASNFGQATLMTSEGASTSGGMAEGTASSSAAGASETSAGTRLKGGFGGVVVSLVVMTVLAVWMG